jgi:hypothetical protein
LNCGGMGGNETSADGAVRNHLARTD